MIYAKQLLCAEVERLMAKAWLARTSAHSKQLRTRKTAKKFITEAEQAEMLIQDLLQALDVLDPLLGSVHRARVTARLNKQDSERGFHE